MKRQVLIEGYRPGGREVFVSGKLVERGYQPAASRPTQAPPPPPKPPSGGSAVSIPKKS